VHRHYTLFDSAQAQLTETWGDAQNDRRGFDCNAWHETRAFGSMKSGCKKGRPEERPF